MSPYATDDIPAQPKPFIVDPNKPSSKGKVNGVSLDRLEAMSPPISFMIVASNSPARAASVTLGSNVS